MNDIPTVSVDALKDAALSRADPLYRWMFVNHEVFRQVVTEAVRPNWRALTELFAAEGLTRADPEAVRQTWWRVRKTLEARAKRRDQMRERRSQPDQPGWQLQA